METRKVSPKDGMERMLRKLEDRIDDFRPHEQHQIRAAREEMNSSQWLSRDTEDAMRDLQDR